MQLLKALQAKGLQGVDQRRGWHEKVPPPSSKRSTFNQAGRYEKMLLKVSDGNGGWVLFDNVEQAHLISKGDTAKDPKELDELGGTHALNLVPKNIFGNDKKISIGVIEFVREGSKRLILFTNIAYVCNDQGDTLDRHIADNRTDARSTNNVRR